MNNTIVEQNTVNVNLLNNLVNNLYTRWFFYQKEGRTPAQFNKLQRAFEAIKSEDMDLARQAWDLAFQNTERQIPGIKYQAPLAPQISIQPATQYTFMPYVRYENIGGQVSGMDTGKVTHTWNGSELVTTVSHSHPIEKRSYENKPWIFRSSSYLQPELNDEVNDLTEAFDDWKPQEDEVYDGYSYATMRDQEAINDYLYPRSFDEHCAFVDTMVERAVDNGMMDTNQNIWFSALILLGARTALIQPMVYGEVFDQTYLHHINNVLHTGDDIGEDFYRQSFNAMRMGSYLKRSGHKLLSPVLGSKVFSPREDKLTHSSRQVFMLVTTGLNRSLRKTMRSVLSHYYDFRETMDGPGDIELLPNTVQITEIAPRFVTEDLTRGLRHMGYRFNRSSTIGIGSAHGAQPYHQMQMDYFYSMFRTRCNELPKMELYDILTPTQYTVGEDGKRRNRPNQYIDQFIRSLCLARWHDESHGTNHVQVISRVLAEKLPYFELVRDIARDAAMELPTSLDMKRRTRFEAEWNTLKSHNWGPFHWKAR